MIYGEVTGRTGCLGDHPLVGLQGQRRVRLHDAQLDVPVAVCDSGARLAEGRPRCIEGVGLDVLLAAERAGRGREGFHM